MSFPSTRPASPKALEARFRYLCPLGGQQRFCILKDVFFLFFWGSMRWHCRFIMATSWNLVFFWAWTLACQNKPHKTTKAQRSCPGTEWNVAHSVPVLKYQLFELWASLGATTWGFWSWTVRFGVEKSPNHLVLKRYVYYPLGHAYTIQYTWLCIMPKKHLLWNKKSSPELQDWETLTFLLC